MADAVNELLKEELMNTKELSNEGLFVATNHAVCVTSAEDSTEHDIGNSIGKKCKHASMEMLQTVAEEIQQDQDESAAFDPDEQEMEEDDITSKLLSIQVLPRIPKRKPVTDSLTTPVGETSSYCSVLERVDSAPSSVGARYPNWSAAGWSRSNIDRPPKRWTRTLSSKDKKAESKPVKRTVTEKQSKNDAKRKAELSENKAKPAAEYSVWSPDAADISSCPSVSEIDQIASDEGSVPSLAGPLPTLPFEEQMRERARLRNLKMHSSFCVENNSSDAAETLVKNLDSNDSSKDGFDSAATVNFPADKTDTNKQEPPGMKTPSSQNRTVLVRSKSSEKRPSQQRRLNENGHKADKQNHRRTSAEHKANRLHSTGKDTKDTKRAETSDELMPKSKKEPASPPLPHLPVLPLFAANVSETSDSSLHRTENKTVTSGKKVTAVFSSNRSTLAGNDVHDADSTNISKLKSATSAAATGVSKSVTFNCNTEVHGVGEATKKSKPNFQYEDKQTMQQCVINEMKVFLKPYYTRRRITKEQYKEVMRSSVTRICRGCPPAGQISASRVRKYAEAYLDKALRLNVTKSSARQDKTAL